MALWCAIRTFAKHATELGNQQPAEPVFFVKPNNCLQRTGPIQVSTHPGSVHHEVECVIRLGNNLQPEAVAIGLDLTDRDTQSQLRSEQLPWTRGKCFRGSAVVGGFVAFDGEFNDLVAGGYLINLSVNGIIKQTSNLSSMSISPKQQMDSLLEWAPVVAGDYLFTGTPAGVAQLLVGDELIATLETTDGKIISQLATICQ
ncbi:MAG: fumarylacetoacetate hydrolase family protein [Candidatus Poseidoniaceae archaeon]|nr:fumarylacetoacetate hydrolase family protein [Candidatus Poseidoniaceae archaeon]